MKNSRLFLVLTFTGFLFCNINAQEKILKIWPEGVPGSLNNTSYTEQGVVKKNSLALYFRVTDPTISVFLPPADKANGMAVIICPGGGYSALAFDYEGTEIASWLNKSGIAGIVLKYRLPSDQIMLNKSVGPLQDAEEAIRIVRRNADQWKISRNKIGIMGFSAGGHLASTLSTHYADKVYESADTTSARPDFSLLIYPVISSETSFTHAGSMKNLMGDNPQDSVAKYFSGELNVNAKTPPAFLVHAANDNVVPVKNSIVYFESLVRFKIQSELHVFQKGGHGFGLALNKETESAWPELCLKWLDENFK